MSERMIIPRKATPPYGLPMTSAPLAIFAKDVEAMKRVTLVLWARRTDNEDLRDITKRVKRHLGPRSNRSSGLEQIETAPGAPMRGPAAVIPPRNAEDRDLPCDPLDVVLTIAGMIWPGLKTWDEERGREETLADVWWGRWGELPGAAILRQGVLHLVYLDRDADRMASCEWLKWAGANWKGPIVHHGIQWTGEDGSKDSPLVARLRRQGSRGACLIWPTRGGLDLRPWRADFGGSQILLRPLGDGFRIASTQGSPLPLRNQLAAMGVFWTWLKTLEVPPEMRAAIPEMIFMDAPVQAKPKGGKGGATKGQESQPALQPLLADAFDAPEDWNTPGEQEFKMKLGPDVDPVRLAQLVKTAEQELMRATMAHNRRNADRWRGILGEVTTHHSRAVENRGGLPG